MTDRELHEKLVETLAAGKPAAVATIIDAHGSTPRKVGAKMLVFADATTFGTIGGGCGESAVLRKALEVLLTGHSPAMVAVDLTDEIGTKNADVCGGRMRVFVEPHLPG